MSEAMTPTPVGIVLVGTGNVASHLAAALAAAPGFCLTAIANRSLDSARSLAAAVGSKAMAFGDIASTSPDIVIVSVADAAIARVAEEIGRIPGDPLCLLTSGTVGMSALAPMSSRVGVLYPLQSFTKGTAVDFSRIPVFTEASDPDSLRMADRLAAALGMRLHHADENRRRTLHIAGVFANNFVNILLAETGRILGADGLPLDVVEPLVRATVDKAFEIGPEAAQTGPARRGDSEVMRSQEQRLPDDLRPVYRTLSKLITDSYKNDR